MVTFGPAFPHMDSSREQTLGSQAQPVLPCVPLQHRVIKLLLEKESSFIALQGKREAMTVRDS